MKDNDEEMQNLSGSLLIAHPKLQGPNFSKSVILLSVHSKDDGALGVVLNQPMGKTLGDLDEKFKLGPLADVPIYKGGPVSPDQMILSAWQCQPESGLFKLYFGITEEKAREIRESEPDAEIRGFLGYAGWSGGQLEIELEQDSWVVSSVDTDVLGAKDGATLWRYIINDAEPSLGFLADAPDDPTLN